MAHGAIRDVPEDARLIRACAECLTEVSFIEARYRGDLTETPVCAAHGPRAGWAVLRADRVVVGYATADGLVAELYEVAVPPEEWAERMSNGLGTKLRDSQAHRELLAAAKEADRDAARAEAAQRRRERSEAGRLRRADAARRRADRLAQIAEAKEFKARAKARARLRAREARPLALPGTPAPRTLGRLREIESGYEATFA